MCITLPLRIYGKFALGYSGVFRPVVSLYSSSELGGARWEFVSLFGVSQWG